MSGAWQVGGASVIGASHARAGRGNEDAIAFAPRTDDPAQRVVAAVSDGHGAAAHFRSRTGSALAAEGAVRLLAWQIDDAGADMAAGDFVADIVEHWRDAVGADIADHPYAADDPIAPWSDPLLPYGATLIAFAADAGRIVASQIGDGDMLFGYGDGRVVRPVPPDRGLVGEETYSLCLPDAPARFRSVTAARDGAADWPDFVCIATDGVAKSFLDDAGFMAAIGALRESAMTDWKALRAALSDWLRDLSLAGSGDDATIAIARRTHSKGE